MSAPVIVWFRRDLRLLDNAALQAAAATGQPVLPLYLHDEAAAGRWRAGGASRWWLHHSLQALRASIRAQGGELLLRQGDTITVLQSLVKATGARAVYWNRVHEPWAENLDHRLRQELGAEIELRVFPGQLLHAPEVIRNRSDQPFKVFTPFWKHCLQQAPPAPPAIIPATLLWLPPASVPPGDRLRDWALCPQQPDWAAGFRPHWQPGEAGAHAALERFCAESLQDYAEARDQPGRDGTSRLSPHLHFGEISPRQAWHAVRQLVASDGRLDRGGEAFLRELGWREFSHHLLHHWPDLPTQPFRPEFLHFPWQDNTQALKAWQQGRTGYPIVDAGMRQLWHTGWMHNRVRMIVASFLVKHLLIPWQAGEEWFHDTLVDADLANNAAGWQWVAGSGADAAPYFRIFNPILQGQKFDPAGDYVRRWVPELAAAPASHIHAPWTLPSHERRQAAGYPAPIVEHGAARERALAAFAQLRDVRFA